MSSMQIIACWHPLKVRSLSPALSPSNYLPTSQACISPAYVLQLHNTTPRQAYKPANPQNYTPSSLFGGKGKPENDSKSLPWKSLEKAMGGLKKESSIEDVLRKQMQQKELDGSDGGAGNWSGGGGDGSGDSEDEGFTGIIDEFVQVILATIGFIFLYIYILNGEEMILLTKDYIKYLFGGSPSVRLKEALYEWERFYQRLMRKTVVPNDWLERAILRRRTWWYTPRLYKHMKRRMAEAYPQ